MQPASKPRYNDSATGTPVDPAGHARCGGYADRDVVGGQQGQQAWRIETAGRFDLDAELELWFSGLGKVRLNFKGQIDIRSIGQLIGKHVL